MGGSAFDYLRERLAATGSSIYLGEGAEGWVTAGPERGALVLGPPRSGKTTSIVVPTVAAAPGPVLSTSTKPDVLTTTVGPRAQVGRCWLFDPMGQVRPPHGVTALRWSPVSAALGWDGAVGTAHCLVTAAHPSRRYSEASHWYERAGALLAALLHAAALDCGDMEMVLRWVDRREDHAALRILERSGAGRAGDVLAGISSTEERERSGIYSTASGVLAAYRSHAALASALAPNFDPALFAQSADTVYVCAPGSSQDTVAPLVVAFIDSIRDAAYRRATSWPPLVLALDEAANIAPLPGLPALVAEGGGQGLVTLACLQDLSQARARWGSVAEGFSSLFTSTVVTAGIADIRTLRAVSALGGDEDIEARSRTRARSWPRRTTVTTSSHRRPRLPVDEISRGRPGHALLLRHASSPSWLRLTPWHSTSPWNEALGGG